MTLFLTSSHTLGWAGPINPANSLLDELRSSLHKPINCVMVSSYPDDIEITDRMAWEIRECFEWADMPFSHFEVIDRRNATKASKIIGRANFIILCGGHVPTENAFIHQIHLRHSLQLFDGVMLTISAGSMNCAENVYAPPELEGEAIDPNYQTYMKGLGLTHINILPHFQDTRHHKIDGKKLVQELMAPFSFNHPIYCLPDGSYFKITNQETILCGKAHKLYKGKLKIVSHDGMRKKLSPSGRLITIK